jgi:methionyl-tRNA formyltransferase
LAGIYLKIIQLEFKKIIILTTDTLHHRFYINRIYEEGFIIDSVFFQKNLPKPNFKTGPLFESKEEKFEIKKFFKTTSRDFNKKIKVYNVNNINDRIVSDKIKIIKPSLGLVFGTSLIKENIYSLFDGNLFNIHRGIPQFYRGLNSDLWAIYNNEYDKLGTTIHMVEKKLDTGDYVYQKFLEIKNSMKIHHIRYYTTILAVDITLMLLEDFFNGDIQLKKQEKVGEYFTFMPLELKKKIQLKFNNYCKNI